MHGKIISGNVEPTACIEPPKRPTQTTSHAKPSNVLLFGRDQLGMGIYRMSVETAEEEIQFMGKSVFGSMRLAAYTDLQTCQRRLYVMHVCQ